VAAARIFFGGIDLDSINRGDSATQYVDTPNVRGNQ
jgi:hypothetical protein